MRLSETNYCTQLHYIFKSGDLPKLESRCDSILKMDPIHVDALAFKAICLKHHKEHDQAMEALDLALEQDSRHLYALIHRAHLFLLKEDFPRAKEDLDFMKKMFVEGKVSDKWTREQVKYVSERATFIYNAISEHEEIQNEHDQQKEEMEKGNSTFKIFKNSDLKKLVKRLKGFTGNLLNKNVNASENTKNVKAKLGSSRITLKTKNILEEVHEKEQIENYKIALARCLSHLNFTIDDIMDRKISPANPSATSILSYIPIGWYNDDPLDQVLENYVWNKPDDQVLPEILKFKNFFSDNPIEEFGFLFKLILEDAEFVEIIMESSKHSQVQDFKAINAKEIIQKQVNYSLLDFFQRDEEILAFIHFEFIKLVILEEKIKGALDINQRITKLFKILQNCNLMEHEIQDEIEEDEKEGVPSKGGNHSISVSRLFYVTDKKYSYFGWDVVKVWVEKGKQEPVEFQFSGEPFEKEISWVLSNDVPELRISIEIQGLMTHERIVTIQLGKLKKNRMNYFDIVKKEEVGYEALHKRSGSLGLFVKE